MEFLRKEVERKQEQIESLTKQLDTQKQDLTKQMEDVCCKVPSLIIGNEAFAFDTLLCRAFFLSFATIFREHYAFDRHATFTKQRWARK